MTYPLTQFARRFWANAQQVREEFSHPFLVWEAPAREHNEEIWMGTQTGAPLLTPRVGEPLVFPLQKANKMANAFGMGITVGRTDNNDLVFPDQSVSRFHAYFQWDAKSSSWKLTDAESKNGTFITGHRLAAQEPTSVANQVRLRFGDVEVVFMEAETFFVYLKEELR